MTKITFKSRFSIKDLGKQGLNLHLLTAYVSKQLPDYKATLAWVWFPPNDTDWAHQLRLHFNYFPIRKADTIQRKQGPEEKHGRLFRGETLHENLVIHNTSIMYCRHYAHAREALVKSQLVFLHGHKNQEFPIIHQTDFKNQWRQKWPHLGLLMSPAAKQSSPWTHHKYHIQLAAELRCIICERWPNSPAQKGSAVSTVFNKRNWRTKQCLPIMIII